GQLGLAVGRQTYKAYRQLLASDRWLRLLNAGARSQRLLWASTGTKDPKLPDLLYVTGLAAPHTVNTMPEKTLHAVAEHGEVGAMLAHDGGDAEAVLARFTAAGGGRSAPAEPPPRVAARAVRHAWGGRT